MPTADVNGTSLEYLENGTGEPVVFVHGGLGDHRIWQLQRETFGGDYRAISYSRRYHWPNAPIPPDADYAMAEQVDDLQAFLTGLGAAPAHLVGNSYGALLCLLLAIREPGLIRSLTLLEPPILALYVSFPPKLVELLTLATRHFHTAAALFQFGAKGIGPATAAFERDDLEEGMRLFVTAVLGPGGPQLMTEERLAQARDNLFKEQFTRADFSPLDAQDVRRITTPTLLLSGKNSPPFLRLLTDRLHEHMPHAERVDVPNASHDAHIANPSVVNGAILSFLARQTTAQPAA